MIDNIKRFVNEHHTLIAVIIGVLVICFIYWWFCCKDRPSANKVRGGYANELIIEPRQLEFVFTNKKNIGDPFGCRCCIGAHVNSSRGYPFYVLSAMGETKVNGYVQKKFVSLEFQPFLEEIFQDPLKVIMGEDVGIGRPIQLCLGVGTNSYVNPEAEDNEQILKRKSIFDYVDIIEKSNFDTELVLGYNEKLNDFLARNVSDLIDEVDYIGQYALVEINGGDGTRVEFEGGVHFDEDDRVLGEDDKIGRKFRVSKPMEQGNFNCAIRMSGIGIQHNQKVL